MPEPPSYTSRFFKKVCHETSHFIKHKLLTGACVAITALIVRLSLWHFNQLMLTWREVWISALIVVGSFVVVILGAFIVNLFRAPVLLDNERGQEISELSGKLAFHAARSRNVDVRDWVGEWGESERQFLEFEHSDVFAEFFNGAPTIRTDRDPVIREKIQAACELAGSRLLRSPGMSLSDVVKSTPEHWARWLCYLKETKGFNRRVSGDDLHDAGYIVGLAQVSAIACVECRAKAFD